MRSNYCTRNGFGALEDLSGDMERVFDSIMGRTVGSVLRGENTRTYSPSLDISETDDAFLVSVDLPGVKPEDVTVEMHEGRLTISGSRGCCSSDEGCSSHRSERATGEFQRVVGLSTDVEVDSIEAKYELGVLHVTLPKVAKQKPKKIEIQTSDD